MAMTSIGFAGCFFLVKNIWECGQGKYFFLFGKVKKTFFGSFRGKKHNCIRQK